MNMEVRNERRNNTIYTDDQFMYKIFREGYSKNDVFMESFITTYIENLGIKVAAIEEVTKSMVSGLSKQNAIRVKHYLN